jgi:ribosomal protein S27AE
MRLLIETNSLPVGHKWITHAIEIDQCIYAHRQCVRCGRDFVMPAHVGKWTAVHVGIFNFSPLDQATNQRWLAEECPGRWLPEDANELRAWSALAAPNNSLVQGEQ